MPIGFASGDSGGVRHQFMPLSQKKAVLDERYALGHVLHEPVVMRIGGLNERY